MKIRRFLLPTLALLGASWPAKTAPAAEDAWRGPLSNRNQFPLALVFIYMKPERATVLPKSEKALIFNLDYSNIIISQATERESLVLDAEYLSAETRLQAGLGRGFELTAAVPFYVVYGGFLDPFISDFHKAFGFPNATRVVTPNNVFRYHYEIDQTPVIERQDATRAIGDITLQLKKAFSGAGPWELALRGGLKLPTGSLQKMTGSGKSDFGAGFALSRVGRSFGGYFNLSYHFLGKPESLDASDYYSLMGAFDWRFKSRFAAVLQYEQLASFLNSELPVLDQSTRQLVLGLRWRRSRRNRFEWRFAEDLSSTAPDFTFAFQWSLHWVGEGI